MNVYLIKASAPGPFKDYKRAMGAPPQNIFSAAAATPSDVILEACDETMGMKPKRAPQADLIAIFFHTPDALHVYAMANHYRSNGYTVILGGLHASFMHEEALEHADAVLIGEVEGIWEELLRDYERGELHPVYERAEPIDLALVNDYPTDLIPPSRYGYLWSVLVSRGCIHRCDFCVVPPFFSSPFRLRPISHIVEEIRSAPQGCWFELHSDNLTANRAYALELFNALKPLGIRWFGEATIALADDPELLEAASNSGCVELLIGIETSSKQALEDSGKDFVDPSSIREKLDRFHHHGIKVTTSMIFGFDSHTPDTFEESFEFCQQTGIDEIQPVILIPFPGTPLFKRLENEGRILTHDWSQYDGAHAVFSPAKMSPTELEYGTDWFWRAIPRNKRVSRMSWLWQIFPSTNRSSHRNERAIGTKPSSMPQNRRRLMWRTFLGLSLVGAGLLSRFYWIWGIFPIVWAIGDLLAGETYLLEPIERYRNPILYWIVILMWFGLGLWSFVYYAAPASWW